MNTFTTLDNACLDSRTSILKTLLGAITLSVASLSNGADLVLSIETADPVLGITPAVSAYPADATGKRTAQGATSLVYPQDTRVWIHAPLKLNGTHFVKWTKNGVDYDSASTTTVLMSDTQSLRPVYQRPPICRGINVFPGIDSVKNAVASAPVGSTFCIKNGLHRFTSSVIPRTGDQFIGENGAVLNGSKIIGPFVKAGSFWVVTGQTQQEQTFPANHCINANIPTCSYPEKVFVNNRELAQVLSLNALRSGTFYFDYANDKIYLADDPTDRIVEGTTGSGGLVGFNGGNSDNVVVRFLRIEKFGGGPFPGSAHDPFKAVNGWVVENNEFKFLSNAGVANYGNGVVRNNHILLNGRYGITGAGTFEGNVIKGNNTDGFFKAYGGGSKFLRTSGVRLRGNLAVANNGRGFWSDYDNIDVLYENNIILNNTEAGIFHEASCAAIIRNNYLVGNNTANKGTSVWHGGQIYSRSSMNLDITGNHVSAIWPGQNAISVRADPNGYSMPNCGATTSKNIRVHNNTIRMRTGQFTGTVAPEAGYATTRNIVFSDNRYFLQDLSAIYFAFENAQPTNKDGWLSVGQDVNLQFEQMQ